MSRPLPRYQVPVVYLDLTPSSPDAQPPSRLREFLDFLRPPSNPRRDQMLTWREALAEWSVEAHEFAERLCAHEREAASAAMPTRDREGQLERLARIVEDADEAMADLEGLHQLAGQRVQAARMLSPASTLLAELEDRFRSIARSETAGRACWRKTPRTPMPPPPDVREPDPHAPGPSPDVPAEATTPHTTVPPRPDPPAKTRPGSGRPKNPPTSVPPRPDPRPQTPPDSESPSIPSRPPIFVPIDSPLVVNTEVGEADDALGEEDTASDEPTPTEAESEMVGEEEAMVDAEAEADEQQGRRIRDALPAEEADAASRQNTDRGSAADYERAEHARREAARREAERRERDSR